jgi:hypothetical protein
MKVRIFFIALILLSGCTKKEYIIEELQLPKSNDAPGSFNIKLSDITNTSAFVKWDFAKDPNNDDVKYDIAINDSVIAYDLKNNSYLFKDLAPNTKYTASVIALDPFRKSTKVSSEFQTMKSFLQDVISFTDYFESSRFDRAIETKDGGVLIGGRVKEAITDKDYRQFILKLDKNYNVQWYHVFETDGYITDIIESNDAGYLIAMNSSVIKVDSNGAVIWNYLSPYPKDNTYIQCAVQLSTGNYVLAGVQFLKIDGNWNVKYTLLKLSANGNELWWKFGGTTLQNRPTDITIEPNGNILIFGTAEYTGSLHDDGSAKSCYWLLWCDESGNFINQKFYKNAYNISDIASKLTKTTDGNYLLMGSVSGSMPPYGWDGRIPRFTKIKPDGSIIWDKYHDLNGGGVMPSFVDFAKMDNSNNLILSRDDRGIAISVINGSGEIEKYIKLYGYPSGIMIRYAEDGNYEVITYDTSSILIFNYDGYFK